MAVTLSNHEIIVIFLGLSPKMVKNDRLKSGKMYRILKAKTDL
ncbi:hypothetical protein ACLB6K_24850 (plasmid) [Microcystis aeruginosa FACHB-524]|nr:hypothetical protein [Microcystis aeruginosa]